MKYIQRKDEHYFETVGQFKTLAEALKRIKEYRISDTSAEYYISSRPCNAWKESNEIGNISPQD